MEEELNNYQYTVRSATGIISILILCLTVGTIVAGLPSRTANQLKRVEQTLEAVVLDNEVLNTRIDILAAIVLDSADTELHPDIILARVQGIIDRRNKEVDNETTRQRME